MQKKIVALAIAGLFSGAVYAQTNVTVYGRVDLSYTYSKSDYKKFQGIENGQGLGGGASRIGFQGEEALGNGLKAIFKLEWGTTTDEGGGPTGARYTYVGLAGNFGQVTLGRNGTPSDLWMGATGVNGISGYEPINLFRGKIGATPSAVSAGNPNPVGIIDGVRWDNSIAYSSPNFSGLDFMAIYSFGEKVNTSDNTGTGYSCTKAGDPQTLPVTGGGGGGSVTIPGEPSKCYKGADTSDAGKLGLGLRYANGPLYLAAAYHAFKDDDSQQPYNTPNSNAGYGAKGWGIGGSYDFKVVKVFANYFRGKANRGGWVNAAPGRDGTDKQTAWSLGAAIPVSSAGTIMAEYAQYKDNRNLDVDAGHKSKGYSLGYKHTLSKRTILHTYATRINNDDGINGGWGKTGVAGQNQTIFSAGIVHLF